MLLKTFAIYDEKAMVYTRPFMFMATGEAVRAFQESAINPAHQFHVHAGDFTLFELGTYDDSTGHHQNLTAHVNLGCALEFKNQALDPHQLLANGEDK